MTRSVYVLAALALAAGQAVAQDIATRPHVFAQQHNGSSQTYDHPRDVQLQLPSNIDTWTAAGQAGARLVESLLVPSPGRIPGFSSIAVFTFAPDGGPVVFEISARDLPPGGVADLVPGGVYSIALAPE